MASIKVLGELMQTTNPSNWVGKISVANRDDAELHAKLEHALTVLENYFTDTDANTFVRCVDGRPSKGPITNKGPQIPGGTILDAVAYRLAARTLHTLGEDMHIAVAQTASLDFEPGGHTDDHAEGEKTGCGAIDGIATILGFVGDAIRKDDLHVLAKSLMGENFKEALFFDAVSAAAELAQNEHYLEGKKPVLDGLSIEKTHSVEQLTGSHNECIAVINMVDHTTFDRNKFAEDSNNQIQAFNYDAWFTFAFGRSLPVSRNIQDLFIHIRVLIGLATFMLLTDGSLKLVVRS